MASHTPRKLIANTPAWLLAAKPAPVANPIVAASFILRAFGPMEFGAWATLASLVYFAGKFWAIRHWGIEWMPRGTIVNYNLAALLPFAWNSRWIFADTVVKRF